MRLFASYGILKKWYHQKIGGDDMRFDRKLHDLDEFAGYEKDEERSNTEVHVFYNPMKRLNRVVHIMPSNLVQIKFCKIGGAELIHHRDEDLPAHICLQVNQNLKLSKALYFKNGAGHRDENLGPQELHFDYSENTTFIAYRMHGLTHRSGKPAMIYSNTMKEI